MLLQVINSYAVRRQALRSPALISVKILFKSRENILSASSSLCTSSRLINV